MTEIVSLPLDRRRCQNRNPVNIQKTRTEIHVQHKCRGEHQIDAALWLEHMTVLGAQGGSAKHVSSCIKSLYLRPSGKSKSWLNQ